MNDTSGFYKLDGDLLYGHDMVLNAAYELHRDQRQTYSYPVDGWYWFDSEDAAREYFGLPPVAVEQKFAWDNTKIKEY